MDWKIDRQRREKKQALAKNESAKSAHLMDEMERGFTQIFGDRHNATFVRGRGQPGDPVRRSELSAQYKTAK